MLNLQGHSTSRSSYVPSRREVVFFAENEERQKRHRNKVCKFALEVINTRKDIFTEWLLGKNKNEFSRNDAAIAKFRLSFTPTFKIVELIAASLRCSVASAEHFIEHYEG